MSVLQRLLGKLRTFRRDRSGATAMIYALAFLPLMIAIGAGVDYARALIVRSNLVEALDAAGLAVGSSPNVTDMQTLAQKYFNANYSEDASFGVPASVTVAQSGQDFTLSTSTSVPTVLMKIVGFNNIPIATSVTITRNSKNVEVALALDVTGSMSGSRLTSLKTAANDLINMVVQATQSPTYSKVAIAPYTNAVNVGSYADQVRGSVTASRAVTITGATRANPIVITAANHGFKSGDYVYITGVGGMTQINNQGYLVTYVDANHFSIGVDGTSWYYGWYSSGGTAYSTCLGCTYYGFKSAAGSPQVFQVSTCVTERTTNAYTDDAPSTTYMGYNYPATASGNGCLNPTIIPLSTNTTTLTNAVNGLTAGGSTAGHIGVAWAWYLLSPNFGSLWPSGSQPGAYGDDKLMKFAIIMTDGAFNSPYCKGVISADAASGSGNDSDHNSCNAPNGSSAYQAQQICTAMKAKGIIVYTVGFTVTSDPSAVSLLTSCATDSSHAYFPNSGSDLQNAFHDIAQQITNLRIKN